MTPWTVPQIRRPPRGESSRPPPPWPPHSTAHRPQRRNVRNQRGYDMVGARRPTAKGRYATRGPAVQRHGLCGSGPNLHEGRHPELTDNGQIIAHRLSGVQELSKIESIILKNIASYETHSYLSLPDSNRPSCSISPRPPKVLDLGSHLMRVNRVQPLQTVTTRSVLIRLQRSNHLRGVRWELSPKS